ncbi:protein of unknown function [Nitrosospira sp. Nl5]|uniref:Lnb N-terminal periplasmic domain-containing protein n=1 Tax=Nitrosospira sp. Nl5 TaxID=200120 RepID=UPI00088ED101|nr:DUF4105 domain-containing protein [Nitrosospira sp. Nl5]SCY32366.1 protein of unknown function [Nitrosospira sp. Nl5]
MRHTCFVVGLLSWFYLYPVTAHSNDAAGYLVELQQQAKQKKLARERVWHLLLKYDTRLLGGMVSEADGMEFFNSPQGKTDSEAELAATLASFFVPLAAIAEGKEHPQCNFPARFKWLNQQLAFDPHRLEIQACDRLDRWMQGLDPVGVTLVFASYFMNNPASMFGHTLVRIDSRRMGSDNNLMNYGANYAAVPDTGNAFLYAMKGLTGGFQGRFAIFPYYTKVQEYNNWESRDLWEYELKFTQDQLNMMLLHLWELGGTYFDYYYFQENCSYHVLSLLEIANPDLRLKDSFFFSVIPADTVKIVMAQEGLVKKAVYRPAVLTQMNEKRLKMIEDEKTILQKLIKGKISPESTPFANLSTRSQALVLNAYMDYLQYRSMQEKSDKEIKIPHSVLLARSRLKDIPDVIDKARRFSSPPELGHGTDRLRVGMGHNSHEPFLEFAYRPAYHDLMAKDVGYDKNSEIIFMDFNLRYYLDSERVRLDRAKILSITSLNPYDPLFAKASWRVDLEIDTLRDYNCHYCNSVKGTYGRGISYRPEFFSPLLLFSFIDIKTEFSGHLKQNYRLGGDIEVGTFYDVTENLRVKLAASYQVFFLGDSKRFFTSHFITRYALSQDLDLRLELNRYDQYNEGVFSVNYFF